jgi:hypothetical protein
MRAYLIITGVLFGFLTVVHVWRIAAEGTQVANPWFIAITLVAAVLCGWAFRLLRRAARS